MGSFNNNDVLGVGCWYPLFPVQTFLTSSDITPVLIDSETSHEKSEERWTSEQARVQGRPGKEAHRLSCGPSVRFGIERLKVVASRCEQSLESVTLQIRGRLAWKEELKAPGIFRVAIRFFIDCTTSGGSPPTHL